MKKANQQREPTIVSSTELSLGRGNKACIKVITNVNMPTMEKANGIFISASVYLNIKANHAEGDFP